MKFVLLNPPNFVGNYTNRDLMGGLGVNNVTKSDFAQKILGTIKGRAIRIPVLSMVYNATLLAKDHDVLVIDAANLELTPEQTLEQVANFQPNWIVSTTSISTVEHELNLLGEMKRQTGATVAVTGDSASLCQEEWIVRNQIDYVIFGDEPELAIRELANKGTLDAVVGVSALREGKWNKAADPGAITNLEELPYPRWDLFPIHSYRYFPILRRLPFVTAQSSRGCPYGCIYCPYTSNQGIKYRFRSAQDVFKELVQVHERYGVASVQFRDPTFTLRKDRIFELCDLIIQSGLKLELGCETRVDCLTEPLIDKMTQAGFRGVNIGVESTDPAVVRNAKRGWIDPNLIEKHVTHMHRNGIRVSGFFVLGLPGENRQTIESTIAFSRKIPLAYAEFKIATPFPGTPLFKMALENGWIQQVQHELYSSYTASMRIHPDLDAAYLEKKMSEAYRKFYFRPVKIFREITSEKFIPRLLQLAKGPDAKLALPSSGQGSSEPIKRAA